MIQSRCVHTAIIVAAMMAMPCLAAPAGDNPLIRQEGRIVYSGTTPAPQAMLKEIERIRSADPGAWIELRLRVNAVEDGVLRVNDESLNSSEQVTIEIPFAVPPATPKQPFNADAFLTSSGPILSRLASNGTSDAVGEYPAGTAIIVNYYSCVLGQSTSQIVSFSDISPAASGWKLEDTTWKAVDPATCDGAMDSTEAH